MMKSFAFKKTLVAGATAAAIFSVASVSYAAGDDYIPDDCALYAVHDGGLNDTQFLSINAEERVAAAFGTEHPAYDIESLDVSNDGILYAASGDDAAGHPNGHLYRVDANGNPSSVGDIVIDVQKKQNGKWKTWFSASGKEVSALSFRSDGSLWGWAEECGLVEIDAATGKAVMKYGEYPNAPIHEENYTFEDLCKGTEVAPDKYTSYVEDMTWDATGGTLYIGYANSVLKYDPVITGSVSTVFDYDKNVETVEMLPSGYVLVGFHDSTDFRVVDPVSPFPSDFDFELEVGKFNDIEGVAWSCESSDKECWNYTAETYDGDGTGYGKIVDLDGNPVASGVGHEIYTMAMQQDGDKVMVVLNSRMPLFGQPYKEAWDGLIGWGDFIMKFGDKTYAVHFTPENDSGVTRLGLYKDVVLKNTTKENYGWKSLHAYARKKSFATMGEISILKNPRRRPRRLSDYNDIIVEQFGRDGIFGTRKIGSNIQSGEKVAGDNFRIIYPEELDEMGFEFPANTAKGEYTFGFTFTKTEEMTGEFFAYVFTECINDGIAIQSSLPMAECVED